MKENPDILELLEKEINISRSKVLFNEGINPGNFREHFVTYNSSWTIENGWLTGRNPEESAGMAILNRDFQGNIMMEFECRTVAPSTHDINFMWNGEWSHELNSCGNAYIGSIYGWYTGRCGIEKSPDYRLRVTVPNREFKPCETFLVHAGSIDGTCFIFINGALALEVDDPNPLDNKKYTKVAFTAWSSHIQVRNIVIRQISWESVSRRYIPEIIHN